MVLPAASFAETQGTLVNNEGRAQRFYSVFPPLNDRLSSWQWVIELAAATENKEVTGMPVPGTPVVLDRDAPPGPGTRPPAATACSALRLWLTRQTGSCVARPCLGRCSEFSFCLPVGVSPEPHFSSRTARARSGHGWAMEASGAEVQVLAMVRATQQGAQRGIAAFFSLCPTYESRGVSGMHVGHRHGKPAHTWQRAACGGQ